MNPDITTCKENEQSLPSYQVVGDAYDLIANAISKEGSGTQGLVAENKIKNLRAQLDLLDSRIALGELSEAPAEEIASTKTTLLDQIKAWEAQKVKIGEVTLALKQLSDKAIFNEQWRAIEKKLFEKEGILLTPANDNPLEIAMLSAIYATLVRAQPSNQHDVALVWKQDFTQVSLRSRSITLARRKEEKKTISIPIDKRTQAFLFVDGAAMALDADDFVKGKDNVAIVLNASATGKTRACKVVPSEAESQSLNRSVMASQYKWESHSGTETVWTAPDASKTEVDTLYFQCGVLEKQAQKKQYFVAGSPMAKVNILTLSDSAGDTLMPDVFASFGYDFAFDYNVNARP